MLIQIHPLQHSHEEAVLVSIPDKAQLSASCSTAIKMQQLAVNPPTRQDYAVSSTATTAATFRQPIYRSRTLLMGLATTAM